MCCVFKKPLENNNTGCVFSYMTKLLEKKTVIKSDNYIK